MSTTHWMNDVALQGDLNLLQTTPYFVVAPQSVEAVAQVVSACAENGWRVMPLGSGSSFPGNFTIRHANTVAIMLRQLRAAKTDNLGRVVLQTGVDVRSVFEQGTECERKTVGGLLCGYGNRETLGLAQDFWRKVVTFDLVDSTGALITRAGPASPSFSLSSGHLMLLHSRGRAGILHSVTLVASALPLPRPWRSLLSADEPIGGTVIARSYAERAIDARAVFDW